MRHYSMREYKRSYCTSLERPTLLLLIVLLDMALVVFTLQGKLLVNLALNAREPAVRLVFTQPLKDN